MSELPSYKKRRRAGTIAFGEQFKTRVRGIRTKLGIPEGGFPREKRMVMGPQEKGFPRELELPPEQAIAAWYTDHVQKATGKRPEDLPRNLPRWDWYFPREIAELIEDWAYSTQPCRPGFHPDVPLDRYAMELVREFGMPEDVVNEVKKRILVEERGGFGISPKVQPVHIPMEGQDGPYYCILIAGVDGSTTKRDWDDIWERTRHLMKGRGLRVGPAKRPEGKIEMRDLTWWHWRIVDGLSYKEIAEKWNEIHPSDSGNIPGEDAIAAAVKRIDRMMHPLHSK